MKNRTVPIFLMFSNGKGKVSLGRIVLLMGCVLLSGITYGNTIEKNPLKFTISSDESKELTTTSSIVKVAFENIGGEDVRLLRIFTDLDNLSIWFNVELTSKDGVSIMARSRGGKISIRGKKEYISLAPGEGFYFYMDIAKMIPNLAKGKYTAKINYYNQYGDNCFKGKVTSNTIDIMIEDDRALEEIEGLR